LDIKVLFSQWFIFPEPGKYHLKLADFYITDSNSKEKIHFILEKKNNIVIEVLPKNTDRLKQICNNLTNVLLPNINIHATGPVLSVKEQEKITQQLAFVTDNIAIPYLKSIITTNNSDISIIAIHGFRRIGTVEAANALIEIMNSFIDANPHYKGLISEMQKELRLTRGLTTNTEVMSIIDEEVKEPPLTEELTRTSFWSKY